MSVLKTGRLVLSAYGEGYSQFFTQRRKEGRGEELEDEAAGDCHRESYRVQSGVMHPPFRKIVLYFLGGALFLPSPDLLPG
jgi:hypothetical protein